MSTVVGLLSDIHADLYSLTRALEVLKENGATRILCAGDLVDRGFDGTAVVKLVWQERIECVLGNHDEDILLGEDEWLLHRAPYEYVSSRALAFLDSLPDMLDVTIEGVDIVVAHGSPDDNSEYLFPTSSAYTLTLSFENADADILVVGHTHQPMCITLEGEGQILNPGSVCQTATRDSGTCAVLTLPERKFDVFNVDTGNPVEYVRRTI